MSVATHLGIKLADYDARIRTFIPDYEEMLAVAGVAIPARTRTIVDLGIGTGALSARCLASAPGARVVGIDVDPAIVALAARRLARSCHVRHGFLPSRAAAALRRRGRVVLAAPCPHAGREGRALPAHPCGAAAPRSVHQRRLPAREAIRPSAARSDRPGSRICGAPTRRRDPPPSSTRGPARTYMCRSTRSWRLMRHSGFRVEVLWRRGAFAVLRAAR